MGNDPLSTRRPLRGKALLAATLLALAGQPLHSARADTTAIAWQLPAQALDTALLQFAERAGIELFYQPNQLRGLRSAPVAGTLSPEQALAALLQGSGWHYRFTGANAVTLYKVETEGAVALPLLRVQGREAALTGTSEGTGSYTVDASSSATKLNLTLRETPQSVSVITRQRIEDQQLHEILEVLDQTVGITVNQGGPIGSDSNAVYARGFQVQNFQVDGINRVNSYGYRDDVSDMAVFDRVEVVRGATGLLSGPGTPSATVNMIRKKPTAAPMVSITAQAGSWDNYRAEVEVSGPLTAGGGVRGRVVGAYQDGNSYIDRQEVTKQVFYAIIEADLTDSLGGRLGFEYQDFEGDQAARAGFPTFDSAGNKTRFPRSFNSATTWSYLSRDNRTVFGTLEQRFGDDWMVRLDLERSDRTYDDVLGYAAGGRPNPATGAGVNIWAGRWAQEPQQWSGDLTVTGNYGLFGRDHQLMAGYSHFKAWHDGEGYPLWTITGYNTAVPNIHDWHGVMPEPVLNPNSYIEFEEKQSGGYLATRLSLTDAASLIVGARVTDWRQSTDTLTYATGRLTLAKRSETGVVTPYAGLVYDLDEHWSVYASYTAIFKPQSRRTPDGTYLDPEEGDNYELGVKGEFYEGRLNASAALFKVEQDNFAEIITGVYYEGEGNREQAYRAVSGTSTEGIELELAGELAPGWQIGAGYAYAPPKNRNGDRLQTTIPKATFKLFSSYRLPGAWDALTVGGNIKWQGTTYADNAGPNRERFTQDDYTIVDLMARYDITEQLTAGLNLNNLLDKRYYSSIGSTGFYGEPRSTTLTLKYRIR